MTAYYNENDPKAAAWLRELIKDGHIAYGIVDERSIKDVQPNDLTDFTQCHFFAGIGGWSYALRLAGWPDNRPVWTGSCPCQPFSDAGQKGGTKDKRHLWPDFFRFIRERRPPVVFGEQVASKDGLSWLDIVSADLESADYAVGAADLCAAGVQAPHIRQRLWFVAHANGTGSLPGAYAGIHCGEESGGSRDVQPERCGATRELGHASGQRQPQRGVQLRQSESSENGLCGVPTASGRSAAYRTIEGSDLEQADPEFGELALTESEQHDRRRDARTGRGEPTDGSELGDANNKGSQRRSERRDGAHQWPTWEAELVDCRDGKRRPIEPGTFPLAHGVPGRVGLLRGYGNAIVPQVAAEFIAAYSAADAAVK